MTTIAIVINDILTDRQIAKHIAAHLKIAEEIRLQNQVQEDQDGARR
jgi:hypothetical protein